MALSMAREGPSAASKVFVISWSQGLVTPVRWCQ